MLAYVMSSRPSSLSYVLAMKRPSAMIERLVTKSIHLRERGDDAAEIAFMTRLVTIIGRRRWDCKRRSLKFVRSGARPTSGKSFGLLRARPKTTRPASTVVR